VLDLRRLPPVERFLRHVTFGMSPWARGQTASPEVHESEQHRSRGIGGCRAERQLYAGPGSKVQKLLFLIDREIPRLVGGPHFNFQSYDFGPFDRDVYDTLEALAAQGWFTGLPTQGTLPAVGTVAGKGIDEVLCAPLSCCNLHSAGGRVGA
jgi:hypothetical protein